MIQFSRYIGIDYSGAQTPNSRLKGLRAYLATADQSPKEQDSSAGLGTPVRHTRWNWTRHELAEWLIHQLSESDPVLVGIDHGFSFPLVYFDKYKIPKNWDTFLDDFCSHWPTDRDHVYVDDVREGECGNGTARTGNARWYRMTEKRAPPAKAVFHFDVPGQVAPSTHAGIPWLRRIRKALGKEVHFSPFDGWSIPPGVHVLAEVYPSLWRRFYPMEDRTQDQHDAYTVCRWLKEKDQGGRLAPFFSPKLTPSEKNAAEIEGWILGVS